MKLKDYDVYKEQREKPFEKTPDPEVLKLKKVKVPLKTKNDKTTTIKIKTPSGSAEP